MNGKEPLLPGLDYNQDQLFFINFAAGECMKYKKSYLEKSLSLVHSLGPFRFEIFFQLSNANCAK
jgi:hypothetical protein